MKHSRIGYRQQQVLDLLKAEGELSARQIKDQLNPGNESTDWAWKRLNTLRQRGLVVQIRLLDRKGKRTKKFLYKLREGEEKVDQERWPDGTTA